MSYIIKKNEPLVNLKLTDIGRKNIASGNLKFNSFGLGDGEMDYSSDNPTNINILRPADNAHDIQYPVPSEGGIYKVPISIMSAYPNEIHASAKERGFFYYNTAGGVTTGVTTGITINSSLWLAGNLTGYTSGSTLYITCNTGSIINSNYSSVIKSGDYLFTKMLTSGYTTTYSGTTQIVNDLPKDPIPYLMYVIQKVSGNTSYDISGFTTGTTIEITVDRDMPSFDSYKFNAFIYPGINTIKDYYDKDIPIAYWSSGLLDFTTNCTEVPNDIPVWNMSIITIEDIIGLDSTTYKGKYTATSRDYWGTAINYDYFATNALNKVGVIHYTNNTVSNFYGEGFYSNTFKLKIPYLMWHKKQFNGVGLANEIGYTFICDTQVHNTPTNIKYYNLIDQEKNPTIVGKVLINEKIILIEHQELLTAMCYKSNRNWTLPKPKLTLIEPGVCNGSSVVGILKTGESLHLTYLFEDDKGLTGIQCEDYATATNTTTTPKDVVFEFPNDNSDPTYSEFSYLKNYTDPNGYGFKTNNMLLLWQKTQENAKPNPTTWNYMNVSRYIGANGCIDSTSDLCDNFELYTEATIYPNSFTNYAYTLKNKEIGDVLVSLNGLILKKATTGTTIGVDGDYFTYTSTTPNRTDILINPAILNMGYTVQFHYLIGDTTSASTFKKDYIVPIGGVPSGSTYSDGIYLRGSTVSLALETQPNNSVVYLFYNGLLISSNNYDVFPTGSTADRRVELTFIPADASQISIFYLDASGLGGNPISTMYTAIAINKLRINLDQSKLTETINNDYNLSDLITLTPNSNTTGHTFGDEIFFYGNVQTDIKATIYKSLITCNVFPNKFINSANQTFNPNQDKVAFTEIAIYDEDDDMVATGKFSQPLQRKYNSDMLVIQATIDF